MNEKLNKIIFGVILIMVSVFFLFRGSAVPVTPVAAVFGGMVFLLLFWTKRKSWALVIGAYMTLFGLSALIEPFIPKVLSGRLFASLFYIVPAAVFFTLYFFKNKRALLTPSMLFLWAGIFTLINGLWFVDLFINSSGLFILCGGLAFISSYLIGRAYAERWVFGFGALLTVFGLLIGTNIITGLVTLSFCVILAAGAWIIIKAVRK